MDPKASLPGLPSPQKRVPKGKSVFDEINRGKEYSKLLEQRHSTVPIKSEVGEPDTRKSGEAKTELDPVTPDDKAKSQQIDQKIKAIPDASTEKVDVKPAELYQQLYPDVYVEKTIVPDYVPNYDDIPRASRHTINRDTLSVGQHRNLLAQPRLVKQRRVEGPYIVRRKVPGPSPRIIQLARPKRRQALETCDRFGATMQKFCIENCHRNIQDVTFVPVQDAVYFIELNKRRPFIEKEKLKLRMKRLQEKINEAKMAKTQEVLRNLYSSLRSYLLPPPLKPENCAECAKDIYFCDKCAEIDNQYAESVNMDAETRKMSLILRGKMEKLLDCKDKIEQGCHWDILLTWITEKLAIWMTKLLNSKDIESEPKVTTDGAPEDTTTLQQSTAVN